MEREGKVVRISEWENRKGGKYFWKWHDSKQYCQQDENGRCAMRWVRKVQLRSFQRCSQAISRKVQKKEGSKRYKIARTTTIACDKGKCTRTKIAKSQKLSQPPAQLIRNILQFPPQKSSPWPFHLVCVVSPLIFAWFCPSLADHQGVKWGGFLPRWYPGHFFSSFFFFACTSTQLHPIFTFNPCPFYIKVRPYSVSSKQASPFNCRSTSQPIHVFGHDRANSNSSLTKKN